MTSLRKTPLSAVALGVSLGVMCGIGMLVAVLTATYGVLGSQMVANMMAVYPGVEISLKGSLIAGAWGFLKGFFSGIILAWIYNLCLCCCSSAHCACCNSNTCKCACNKSPDVEKITLI